MIVMQHGISDQQWLEFIDGTLDEHDSRRIRTHTQYCGECAQLCSELMVWHDAIVREATDFRRAIELPDDQVDRMLADTLDRIRTLEPAQLKKIRGWTNAEALMLLRSLVEPYCGFATASAMMSIAVRRATAGGERQVTRQNWAVLVANLSEASSSICGLATGRLVDRAGLLFAIQET